MVLQQRSKDATFLAENFDFRGAPSRLRALHQTLRGKQKQISHKCKSGRAEPCRQSCTSPTPTVFLIFLFNSNISSPPRTPTLRLASKRHFNKVPRRTCAFSPCLGKAPERHRAVLFQASRRHLGRCSGSRQLPVNFSRSHAIRLWRC